MSNRPWNLSAPDGYRASIQKMNEPRWVAEVTVERIAPTYPQWVKRFERWPDPQQIAIAVAEGHDNLMRAAQ